MNHFHRTSSRFVELLSESKREVKIVQRLRFIRVESLLRGPLYASRILKVTSRNAMEKELRNLSHRRIIKRRMDQMADRKSERLKNLIVTPCVLTRLYIVQIRVVDYHFDH